MGHTHWSNPKSIAGIYIGCKLELTFYLMHVFVDNVPTFYAAFLNNWNKMKEDHLLS